MSLRKKRTSGAQLTGKSVFFGNVSCESEISEKMVQVRSDAIISNHKERKKLDFNGTNLGQEIFGMTKPTCTQFEVGKMLPYGLCPLLVASIPLKTCYIGKRTGLKHTLVQILVLTFTRSFTLALFFIFESSHFRHIRKEDKNICLTGL